MRANSWVFVICLLAFCIELLNPTTRFVRSGMPRQDKIVLFMVDHDADSLPTHAKAPKRKPTFPDKAQVATRPVVYIFETRIAEQLVVLEFTQRILEGFSQSIDPPPIA